MISNWEIWACANLVIMQHGKDAKLHAAGRADELLDQGDMEGKRVWCRILIPSAIANEYNEKEPHPRGVARGFEGEASVRDCRLSDKGGEGPSFPVCLDRLLAKLYRIRDQRYKRY